MAPHKKNGDVLISEIHTVRDGIPHGFEWWLNWDQKSVWHERHWFEGKLNGIERMWDETGNLMKGFPKYQIMNTEVSESEYLKKSEKDSRLPLFTEADQNCERIFPADIDGLS